MLLQRSRIMHSPDNKPNRQCKNQYSAISLFEKTKKNSRQERDKNIKIAHTAAL